MESINFTSIQLIAGVDYIAGMAFSVVVVWYLIIFMGHGTTGDNTVNGGGKSFVQEEQKGVHF